MSLSEAISDLRDTIKHDGFSTGLVEEVASEHDVKPQLLERKFTDHVGKAPADYKSSAGGPTGAEILQAQEEKTDRQMRLAFLEMSRAIKNGTLLSKRKA